MKSIFMIDGGFFEKKFRRAYPKVKMQAEHVKGFVDNFSEDVLRGSDTMRVYYYDCPPFSGVIKNPATKDKVDLGDSPTFKWKSKLLKDLRLVPFFAVREGRLRLNRWSPSHVLRRLKKNPDVRITGSDLKPKFEQKGVDMKIGLDIAWASLQKVAERLVLVTADADFTPAIKFARREGLQVYLSTLANGVHGDLKENSDVWIGDSIFKFLGRIPDDEAQEASIS
jgi:uncharacterized LabA/DUF88 family protein